MDRGTAGGAAPEVFDERIDAWRDWQEAPWGRIRYRVVEHTLGLVVEELTQAASERRGKGRLRVLDAGGGDGADAVALAARGADVVVLDSSGPLLALAREAADRRGCPERVRTVQGELEQAEELGLGRFDLVLCHNVLQYVAEVAPAVAALVQCLDEGGVVSLVAPNPAAEVLVAAVRGQSLHEAHALMDAPVVRSRTFDHEVRRLAVEEATAALATAGARVAARFGIRCVTDLIVDDERKREPAYFADLERLELALCDREPFVRTARFWQLVAHRS